MMSVDSAKQLATPKSPAFNNFSFDDDDDDELLLLPLPPPRKAVNSKDSVKATSSKASGKLGAEQYLEQLEKELQEECRQLFNSPSSASRDRLSIKKQAPPSDSFDDNHYTVYYHCPVCLVPGHQSATKTGFTIAHIKGCAQKAGLGPREVISRLRSCPQRQRLKPKKVERPKKKPSRSKKSPSNLSSFEKRDCQLTQLADLSHQAKHLSDRVASVLNPGKLAFSVGALDPYLPPRWLAARLDSPPETYYVPGFEKYFNFATAAAAKESELEQTAAKLN